MIFIWKRIVRATDNYHTEGGLAVIAETLGDAIKLAEKEGAYVKLPDELPDYTAYIDTNATKCFVFKDAGCC